MIKPLSPESFPENEELDPVGEPYPNQQPVSPGDDPSHPPFSPDNEPDIPADPESERVVQPEPVKP